MSQSLRILRHAAAQGLAEFRLVYTWKTWLSGWLLRLLTQVTFFALIGQLLGSQAEMRYIVVGNAVALITLEAMVVIASSAWERQQGTLPLLVAAPAGHVPVYLGRGVQWLVTGMVSSATALALLPFLLGVPLPWPRALAAFPMLALVGVTSYCLGCFLASLVLRLLALQWLVLNLGYLVPMTIGGVNVPVAFWPAWVQAVANVLPLTHGLRAIRLLLAGMPAGAVWSELVAEAAVGACWLLLAVVSLNRLAEHGRRDGSIEFAG
jgi:ABC-2 type transport system permease protein